MSGEEFLQKFGLHLGPISNAPRPQGVKPIFYFILQCEREKLEPYQVQSGSILLEGVANLLKFPDVCIGILTLHTMEGGEKWHQVRPNNHVLSWGYNAGCALIHRGCMWSLMDLKALRFLSAPC